ncbi:hypothetical protein [Merismopedia glauca]|uniref:Uncharacterized protein n=1 Tax=Merismopedia glauca CCAP 1448/3 TaxID=1296344 RepID=A0A2T1C7J1_9CYAN|nr:hypothetical protein [Merismopedia glauca]PSB04221.1 hypothetical protein C7B64_05060 [Merismopedia glauca CCAP 1448/3]
MFDDLFSNLKDLIGSKMQEAAKEVEKRFAVPEPTEPFILIHKFTSGDSTVTKGGITVIEEGWQIEAYDDNTMRLNTTEPIRKVILFEVPEPNHPECVLACRFQAKALNAEKSITVKIGIWKQQQIGTSGRFWTTGVLQSESFHSFEIRAHFKKGTVSTKVQIIVEFESSGILQIKNIELLQATL